MLKIIVNSHSLEKETVLLGKVAQVLTSLMINMFWEMNTKVKK